MILIWVIIYIQHWLTDRVRSMSISASFDRLSQINIDFIIYWQLESDQCWFQHRLTGQASCCWFQHWLAVRSMSISASIKLYQCWFQQLLTGRVECCGFQHWLTAWVRSIAISSIEWQVKLIVVNFSIGSDDKNFLYDSLINISHIVK